MRSNLWGEFPPCLLDKSQAKIGLCRLCVWQQSFREIVQLPETNDRIPKKSDILLKWLLTAMCFTKLNCVRKDMRDVTGPSDNLLRYELEIWKCVAQMKRKSASQSRLCSTLFQWSFDCGKSSQSLWFLEDQYRSGKSILSHKAGVVILFGIPVHRWSCTWSQKGGMMSGCKAKKRWTKGWHTSTVCVKYSLRSKDAIMSNELSLFAHIGQSRTKMENLDTWWILGCTHIA